MKRLRRLLLCLVVLAVPSAGLGVSNSSALVPDSPAGISPASVSSRAEVADPDKLVYADFENLKDKRPYSNRGGHISLFSYQEQPTNLAKFKGIAGTDAPEAVRLKQDDPSRAITFEYEMRGPNAWAGVGVEIYGQPEQDGKPGADDVSRFKFLTLQLYVTNVTSVTAEFSSRGHGIMLNTGFPQLIFKVFPGFNTYKVPLGSIGQPSWVDTRLNPKDLLKKLTSVRLSVSCAQCVPLTGTVVIDNLIFQN